MRRDTALSLTEIIERSLKEDLGRRGDITSRALFDATKTGSAVITSQSAGILSGVQVLKPLFRRMSPSLSVKILLENGAALEPGSSICTISGPIAAILGGERVALNFLQHLSGIATATNDLARRVAHTKAKILDTRKTTPLLRPLEKEAVRHGGGRSHRSGLFDMILIKNTHIKAAGGVGAAMRRAQEFTKRRRLKAAIEIETRSVAEFKQALACRPDRIMLDNMSVADMTACVALARMQGGTVELEASGNVSAANVAAIAETGVDFISAGSITHSAAALDMHLEIQ